MKGTLKHIVSVCRCCTSRTPRCTAAAPAPPPRTSRDPRTQRPPISTRVPLQQPQTPKSRFVTRVPVLGFTLALRCVQVSPPWLWCMIVTDQCTDSSTAAGAVYHGGAARGRDGRRPYIQARGAGCCRRHPGSPDHRGRHHGESCHRTLCNHIICAFSSACRGCALEHYFAVCHRLPAMLSEVDIGAGLQLS